MLDLLVPVIVLIALCIVGLIWTGGMWDAESENYNPLIYRYGLTDGQWTPESRAAFTATADHSVRLLATAYELWDFGCWSAILERTVYPGLFQTAKAVLSGTYRAGRPQKKDRRVEETT